MDETSPSSDDDYVEKISDAEPGPSRWNLRKRKRESVDVTPNRYNRDDAFRRPTSKTRRRDSESVDREIIADDNSSEASLWLPRGGEGPGRQSAVFPYIEIFNSTLNDFLSGEYVKLDTTRLGTKTSDLDGWAAQQRDIFTRALQLLHFADYAQIAHLTGKSKKEVQDRFERLEEQLEVYHSDEDLREELAHPNEFPIAFEISPSGIALLDACAERLQNRELAHEKQYARRVYGRYAIIDQDAARDLSQMETLMELRKLPNTAQESEELNHGEQRRMSRSRDRKNSDLFIRHHGPLIEAAQLLRPRKFLDLSECLFMNSGPPRQEDNWMAVTDDSEPPSMMRTAFIDFYTLTIRLTKKLVAASLFHAEARIKVVDDGDDGVSLRDVTNASNTLGLKCNWKEYWANVTQRCNVQVFDEPAPSSLASANPEPVWLSPDEVESTLADEIPSTPEPEPKSMSYSSLSPNLEEIPKLPFDDGSDPDAAYDDYLDDFDREMSRRHELSLYETLERQAPAQLRAKHRIPPTPRLHQLGDHAHPRRLRDLLERSSEVQREALELSSIRTKRRSSGGTTDRSSNVREEERSAARQHSIENMNPAADDEVIVDESAPSNAKRSESSSENEEPPPRRWKGKERAVPFPTGISRVEDLIYSSDEN